MEKELFNVLIKSLNKFKKNIKLYEDKYKDIDVSDCKSITDLPIIDKKDLQEYYFSHNICLDNIEKYVCFHSTSGTTGNPIMIPYTKKDVNDWDKLLIKCYKVIGITNKDVVQISFKYGMWTAGTSFQRSLQKLGSTVVPAGIISLEKQIEYIKNLKVTVLITSPYFAVKIANYILENKINHNLKKIVCGSEPLKSDIKYYIENSLNAKVYDIYGLSEVYGPGVAISSENNPNLISFNDYFYLEIIDPITKEKLEDGQEGELVITTLKKEGLPLIRFNTHDITKIIKVEDSLKSDYCLISPIKRRTDTLVKYKGVLIPILRIEEYLKTIEDYNGNYQLIFYTNEKNIDCSLIKIELKNKFDSQEVLIRNELKNILGVEIDVALCKPNTIFVDHKKRLNMIDYRK